MRIIFRVMLIILGIIALIPIIGFGLYYWDIVYYEKMSYKAEKAALIYMEDMYRERFEIEKAKYSLPLGDDTGSYTIDAHPVNNPKISIRLHADEDFKINYENYKEMKWRNDAIILYLNKIKPIFSSLGDMYVNPSFPQEISKKYTIKDNYQLIFKENPQLRDEYFHLLIFEDKQTFQEQEELKKISKLLEIIKARQLEDYTIELKYYSKELVEKYDTYLTLHDFENDHRDNQFYFCRFSKDILLETQISKYEELERFCRR